MDLNAIATFVKVVEAGSFVAAARTTGVTKSTVARRIDRENTGRSNDFEHAIVGDA